MTKQVTAAQFRQDPGELLDQVQYGNDSIVIQQDGKPLAALVDPRLFERICRMREEFDSLTGRIVEAYARVPANEGMAEIDAAVEQERHG